MKLTLNKEEGFWAFDDMERIHVDLLEYVEEDSDTSGEAKARRRLFPNPLDEKSEQGQEEFISDWKEFVGEDLEQKFSGDVGMVLADLDGVQSYEQEEELRYRLLIPLEHGWNWYSAFNQARLALDAIYEFHADGRDPDEEDPPAEDASEEENDRYAAYIRFGFYGIIQDWMVRNVLD